MKKKLSLVLLASMLLMLLAGCGTQDESASQPVQENDSESMYIDVSPVVEVAEISDEAVALSEAPQPVQSGKFQPTAPGTQAKKSDQATIDYSNAKDGYVMITSSSASGKRLKVQVTAATTYTYDLKADTWTTFPLSDGNGKYQVTVFENIESDRYATVLSASFDVTLANEFGPFLYPNQYVDYGVAKNTVAKAAELTNGETDTLKKVQLVYDYVVSHITYDSQKAATVKSGYLPVLDNTLAEGKGICFDYAALMTGMLRSQDIPCKLVVGYAGQAYHAWVSVWTEESGWVDGAIFFDGTSWQRMDPTFISSSKNSAAIQKYVGDGSNYTTKYLY